MLVTAVVNGVCGIYEIHGGRRNESDDEDDYNDGND